MVARATLDHEDGVRLPVRLFGDGDGEDQIALAYVFAGC